MGNALSVYNRKEFHHIFPQKVLKDWGVSREPIGSLANICMLASSENKRITERNPSDYIKEYQSTVTDFDAVMDSNLIPPKAVECLLEDDFVSFLEVRSDFLSKAVQRLI